MSPNVHPAPSHRDLIESIYKLGRVLETWGRNICKGFEITSLQGQVLLEIAKSQPVSMGELARQMKSDGSILTKAVNKLVAAGLVDRWHTEEDRRRVLCSLNKPKGPMVAHHLDDDYKNSFKGLVKGRDGTNLYTMLREINSIIEKAEAHTHNSGNVGNSAAKKKQGGSTIVNINI